MWQKFDTLSGKPSGKIKWQTLHTLERPYKLRYMMVQKPAVWQFATSFWQIFAKDLAL